MAPLIMPSDGLGAFSVFLPDMLCYRCPPLSRTDECGCLADPNNPWKRGNEVHKESPRVVGLGMDESRFRTLLLMKPPKFIEGSHALADWRAKSSLRLSSPNLTLGN